MRWFGRAYGAPYEADTPHAETPVGKACAWCDETIGADDDGLLVPLIGDGEPRELSYHYECHLRKIVGGLNHQMRRCSCYGGTEPQDPPNMSLREGARLAVKNWMNTRGRQP